jgi:hypothetical protein
MRISCFLIVASVSLLPAQAFAQSGGVGGSGSAAAGVTTGTAKGSGATGAPDVRMPGPPGTNSAGTAQSSGEVTTGSASRSTSDADAKIRAEDPKVDQTIKGICKGC